MADNPPAISIALATFNGAKHLRQQLDSLANQSELPFELVVSDDNSSDDTLSIIEDFGQTAPFQVTILPKHDRLGFSDNFLHAAEQCRSPLVMFCDQDDVWLPEKLAISRRKLLEDDSLLLLHTLTFADAEMQPLGPFSQGITKNGVYERLALDPFCQGYGNTMLFRRDLLHLIPRAERPSALGRTLSHDTWIYTLAAALGRVSHLTQSLILYRQHSNNLTRPFTRSWLRKIFHLASFEATHQAEIARFDGEAAKLFEALADRRPDLASLARSAAERYRQRQAAIELRTELFSRGSIVRRLRAFAALERRNRHAVDSFKRRSLATAKNFFIGVLGLGWRI